MWANSVTGLVLAGGRGSRMGGVDKGLQPFHGEALVQHALARLRAQTIPLASVMINANRHQPEYLALGAPVWSDPVPDQPGPLAGFWAGMSHCDTPWLLTVPCDCPCFPADLLERLSQAVQTTNADVALPVTPSSNGQWRAQPVFCLLKVTLQASLQAYLQQGGHKVGEWLMQQRHVKVQFDQPHDDPQAFANANTLDELLHLEQRTRASIEPLPS